MKEADKYRFLFAGGGTGGHLYPAIAVAEKIRSKLPSSEILFLGTKHKLESSVVPSLQFKFKTLWISGFSRKPSFGNLLFPVKLLVAMIQSLFICIRFKPRVAVGTGAYISGPAIWGASILGAKIILLEQNSYPGITNRILEKRAEQIHINFEESGRYFRNKKNLFLSGNPLRSSLIRIPKKEAAEKFNLNSALNTLLVIGGSLGAGTINEAISKNLDMFVNAGIQILWQTGMSYYSKYADQKCTLVRIMPYISDMAAAYSVCDLALSRAGAMTISELAFLGVPSVLIPSPNVAADHQFRNAQALEAKQAAVLLKDSDIGARVFEVVTGTLSDPEKLILLGQNIRSFFIPGSADKIASEVIKFAEIV